jgi:hypothetical protein
MESNRPFACRDPLLTDRLPSFGRDFGETQQLGTTMKDDSGFPALIFETTNPYARSAQATYIISLVFSHINKQHHDAKSRNADVEYLDKMLQGFALSTIIQANNDKDMGWGHSCGAFSIVLKLVYFSSRCNPYTNTHCSAGSGHYTKTISARHQIPRSTMVYHCQRCLQWRYNLSYVALSTYHDPSSTIQSPVLDLRHHMQLFAYDLPPAFAPGRFPKPNEMTYG